MFNRLVSQKGKNNMTGYIHVVLIGFIAFIAIYWRSDRPIIHLLVLGRNIVTCFLYYIKWLVPRVKIYCRTILQMYIAHVPTWNTVDALDQSNCYQINRKSPWCACAIRCPIFQYIFLQIDHGMRFLPFDSRCIFVWRTCPFDKRMSLEWNDLVIWRFCQL